MNKIKSRALLGAIGLITGFVNGFFGGGGGMIIVPLLIYVNKEAVKKAHATALLIILPVSIVSAAFYFSFGSLDYSILLKSGGGVIAGGLIGALLLPKMSNNIIKIVFSAVMLAAGIKMIF
jgi:uncharacterized membrane protein YfcA